jgi:ABC-type multidrug transport system fused ATPase/permease subunit
LELPVATSFLRLYRRVTSLLAPEGCLAAILVVANLALAAAAFIGPLLFGWIIDTLANATRPAQETWRQILLLLGLWGVIGIGSIGAVFANGVDWRR